MVLQQFAAGGQMPLAAGIYDPCAYIRDLHGYAMASLLMIEGSMKCLRWEFK